jgi:predicted AlkP superfamily pyrophosphatase or phosphodiesterase
MSATVRADDVHGPIRKALVIGIDGCRTDALLAAKAPHLHGLIRQGAFSEATEVLGPRPAGADTVSGPGWSNILTGVWPDKHGVTDNKFKGARLQEYPHFFRRLKEHQPRAFTASLVVWEPIHQSIVSAADDSRPMKKESEEYRVGDARLAEEARKLLAEGNPDVLFLHFDNVDGTGHKKGFHPKVPEYLAAIEGVDAHIGSILQSLRQRPTYAREDWLIVVCTDHGGQGTGHSGGATKEEIRRVFLIVSGSSVAPGKIEGPTALVDVVPTVLTHLQVPLKSEWKLDGQARYPRSTKK